MDKLRRKWAGSELEIVVEKTEMLSSWKGSKSVNDDMIKEELLDRMLDNDQEILMEEGEDILDGLEGMVEADEISDELLLDTTEMITALIIARGSIEDMPTFTQVMSRDPSRTFLRMNRAENMIKMRKSLEKMKEGRKPTLLQNQTLIPPPNLEVKKVKRRDSSRRMDSLA